MDPMDQALRINAKEYAVRSTWSSATFSDVTEYFKKAGAKACWITQGVDTDIFYPKDLPKIYDIVFVGTKSKKRLRYINALKKESISVSCFGEGWENSPVYQEKLADIYRKSRIVLNFCRPGAGFSIRAFQVMGAGAFLLSEYCTDLDNYFVPCKHMDYFKTEGEMLQKHGYILKRVIKWNQFQNPAVI